MMSPNEALVISEELSVPQQAADIAISVAAMTLILSMDGPVTENTKEAVLSFLAELNAAIMLDVFGMDKAQGERLVEHAVIAAHQKLFQLRGERK